MISSQILSNIDGSENQEKEVRVPSQRRSNRSTSRTRRNGSPSRGSASGSKSRMSKDRSQRGLDHSEGRNSRSSQPELMRRCNASSSESYRSSEQQDNHGEQSVAGTIQMSTTQNQSPELFPETTHHVKSSDQSFLGPAEKLSAAHVKGIDSAGHQPIYTDIEQSSPIKSRTEDKLNFTNDPHPALETPLLYFILRHHPKLLSSIQAFYNFRWGVMYPLQNRVPGSWMLRKFKIILTWNDVLLRLPFAIFLILGLAFSFATPSVYFSGHASRTPLILVFVTATRNNILTFFLGMPVERAIRYHKLAARLAYVNGLLHTYVAFQYPVTPNASDRFATFLFQDVVNFKGSLLVISMTATIVTALPCVRKKLFEFFYLVHITLAILMILCAFYHTGYLVPLLVSLTWGLDVLVRKIYMPFFRYPRSAKLEIISDTVVEVSFPKQDGFDFNPGQYVYICVPKLGNMQWHPFSLSSSPKQETVTLHIRKGGDWTRSLYSLSEKHAEVAILMEGPYGSVGVDLISPLKYQTVMLVSGGIGVTPMQSLCNSLMHEHFRGMRKLRKLSFIWMERDPVLMPEVDVVRRETIRCLEESSRDFGVDFESADKSSSCGIHKKTENRRRAPRRSSSLENLSARSGADGTTRLAEQLLSLVPPGLDTDDQMDERYPSESLYHSWDADGDDQSEEVDAEPQTHIVDTVLQEDDEPIQTSRKSVSFNVDKPHAPWKAGQERAADGPFLDHAFQRAEEDAMESSSSPLDLRVFLTNTQASQATRGCMPPFVTIGRPDLKRIFCEARRDARRHDQRRVAVCVCAPVRIVNLCRTACAKYSDREVTFDFHCEVFE